MVTEYCWGGARTDDTLDKTRGMLGLAILTALGKMQELKSHTRARFEMGAQSKKSPKSRRMRPLCAVFPPGLMRSEVRVRHSIRRKKKACCSGWKSRAGARPSIRSVIWAFRRLCHNVAELLETTGFPSSDSSGSIGSNVLKSVQQISSASASGRSMELACSNTSGGGTRKFSGCSQAMYSD